MTITPIELVAKFREIARMGTPGELTTYLLKAAHCIEALSAELAAANTDIGKALCASIGAVDIAIKETETRLSQRVEAAEKRAERYRMALQEIKSIALAGGATWAARVAGEALAADRDEEKE